MDDSVSLAILTTASGAGLAFLAIALCMAARVRGIFLPVRIGFIAILSLVALRSSHLALAGFFQLVHSMGNGVP